MRAGHYTLCPLPHYPDSNAQGTAGELRFYFKTPI